MPSRRRTVLVLSEQTMFRQLLASALREAGFVVTDQSCSSPLRSKRHEVAVIDLVGAATDTMTLVEDLHEQLPDSYLVLVGTATRLAASLDGHADVEVEVPRADLAAVIAAINGRPPSVSTELARAHRLWAQVTQRQRDVMRWLAHGLDNPGIALKLRVGTRAVKAHISALLALFGLDSRTQLALIAYEGGLRAQR